MSSPKFGAIKRIENLACYNSTHLPQILSGITWFQEFKTSLGSKGRSWLKKKVSFVCLFVCLFACFQIREKSREPEERMRLGFAVVVYLFFSDTSDKIDYQSSQRKLRYTAKKKGTDSMVARTEWNWIMITREGAWAGLVFLWVENSNPQKILLHESVRI